MAWRVELQSIFIAIALFGWIGPTLADSTFDKDQFTRDRPQVSPPTQEPETRAPLPPPPPVDCPPGQHMEGGFCVVDTPAVTTKYGAIAVGTKSNTWYGVAWDRDTEEAAKSAAMDGCMNQARKKGSTNCRVVHSFSEACVAMAWLNSGTDGGPLCATPRKRRKAPPSRNAAATIRAGVACSPAHGVRAPDGRAEFHKALRSDNPSGRYLTQ